MNDLTSLSKMFNESTPEAQSEIVEEVYQKITYVNPLAPICNQINQKQVRVCPKCGKSHFILYGKKKDIQNYYCKSCGKYFSEFSGTTISYIKKKDKLKTYIFLMLSGSGILVCAIAMKISVQTSFDWRHKILSSLGHYVPKHYSGISEMMSVEVRFSRKGQGAKIKKMGQKGKITDPSTNKKAETIQKGAYKPLSLVAIIDRTRNFEITIVQQGTLEEKSLNEQIGKKLNKVNKLCLVDNMILKQFAGKKKISYLIRKTDCKVKGCNRFYHTQNIQEKYNKLNSFMDRFHGVSSSYLQNYLYWYMMLDHILHRIDSSSVLIEKSISINNGKENYKKCKMFE
jgi:transposase-like protein